MRGHIANLPHRDLAYFQEGSPHFADYVFAVDWAQRFARENRAIMMSNGCSPRWPRCAEALHGDGSRR
jgi:tRNA-splicing ligase RtcB